MDKSKKTKTTQEDSQNGSQSKENWWKNMTITDKDKERYKFWEDMWNGINDNDGIHYEE